MSPPAAAPRVAPQAPRRRARAGTDEHDARLAKAFEACQDLFFLASPAEALDFTTRLLLELVPSEALSGCLYDINTDEFRFVSVHGPGAEERQGEAVPANVGIMGVAAHAHAGPMRVVDARQDARYDPGVDGRIGVEILDMCYLPLEHQGRLLGMVQAINRGNESGFTEKDVDLFNYVGKQTSEFLFRARIAPDKRKT
ncbi:MAG: GAF domain-containing protein [Deltaproteobacteria bacterium]|nr:GAF domain-containing protein [Deltaproteobacteria bacterium]